MSQLPILDRINRMQQHEHIQAQVVAIQTQHPNLNDNKQRNRPPRGQARRQTVAKYTASNIPDRVGNAIAEVTERKRRLAVPLNHYRRVFKDLPNALNSDRRAKPANCAQFATHQSQHGKKYQPMRKMREAVRVDKVLRRVRIPNA